MFKRFKNNNCLFFYCAYVYSFLCNNIRVFCGKKRGFINNVLSWVSFSFNILISWVISVMKNSFIICCKIYIYFFFIFFFNFYFKNYKYEISAFYRFFKRDSNIEIISNN